MSKVKQPILPGCPEMPLRFKHVPLENGDGKALGLCTKCNGSGELCRGEKEVTPNPSTPPQMVYANFSGKEKAKYQRKGYAVKTEVCGTCRGAGMVVEG